MKKFISILLVFVIILSVTPAIALAETTTVSTTQDTQYDYINSIFKMFTYNETTVQTTLGNTTIQSIKSEPWSEATVFCIKDNLFITAAHALGTEQDPVEYGIIHVLYTYVDPRNSKVKIASSSEILRVAYIDRVHDVAIMYGTKITAKYCNPMNVDYNKTLQEGDEVTVYGFPSCTDEFTTDKGTYIFSTNVMAEDDGNELYMYDEIKINNCVILGGVSGGPAVDSNNNVIGVASASSDVNCYEAKIQYILDGINKITK